MASRSQRYVKAALDVVSQINPMVGVSLGLKAFMTPMKANKKPHLLPQNMKSTSKVIKGKTLKVYNYGKSPRKVLLVHGWEGAATDFFHFFDPLVENGFEVVAVDLPGHGFAPKTQLNAIIAADIIRHLEVEIGPFTAIIGHSFGAFSTGYALSVYPELEDIPFISIGSPNKLKNILLNFANLVEFSSLQTEFLFSKVEKDLNFRVKDFEHGQFIKTHTGPVLVVHDKKDKQVPYAVVDEIQQVTVKPEFLITEGLGHNRILRDSQTIQNVIQFIKRWQDSRIQFENALKFGLI